jgi:hypothetical protein
MRRVLSTGIVETALCAAGEKGCCKGVRWEETWRTSRVLMPLRKRIGE